MECVSLMTSGEFNAEKHWHVHVEAHCWKAISNCVHVLESQFGSKWCGGSFSSKTFPPTTFIFMLTMYLLLFSCTCLHPHSFPCDHGPCPHCAYHLHPRTFGTFGASGSLFTRLVHHVVFHPRPRRHLGRPTDPWYCITSPPSVRPSAAADHSHTSSQTPGPGALQRELHLYWTVHHQLPFVALNMLWSHPNFDPLIIFNFRYPGTRSPVPTQPWRCSKMNPHWKKKEHERQREWVVPSCIPVLHRCSMRRSWHMSQHLAALPACIMEVTAWENC